MTLKAALPRFVLLASLSLAACQPLIAGYSLQAYQNATTLKADVANLVSESTTPYDSHAADISALTLKLNEAREFSAGEATNTLSTTQWDILLNQKGHLYYGFLHAWQSHGTLNAAQLGNWKTLLDRGFDSIICLEANKQSATACPAPEALPTPGATP